MISGPALDQEHEGTPEQTPEQTRGGEVCGQGRASRWMNACHSVRHPPNRRASVRICGELWKARAVGNRSYAGKTRCHPQSTAPITTTAFLNIILIPTESESM
jgi:hypothetical protein